MNNMPNMLNAILDTTKSNKNETLYQNIDITHQLKAKLKKNQLLNIRVLKIANKNVIK